MHRRANIRNSGFFRVYQRILNAGSIDISSSRNLSCCKERCLLMPDDCNSQSSSFICGTYWTQQDIRDLRRTSRLGYTPLRQLHHSVQNAGSQEEDVFDDSKDFQFDKGQTMGRFCDGLIQKFSEARNNEDELRKLIMKMSDWAKVKPYFFKRCKFRAIYETDTQRKELIILISEKVKTISEEIEQHNQLLALVEKNWSDLYLVVVQRRNDFNNAFFNHIKLHSDLSQNRTDIREGFSRVAANCLAAVEAHDVALVDDKAVEISQKTFKEIIKCDTLKDACDMIDELGKKEQVDFTLFLFFAKAWAGVKESNTMNQELKDLMQHLYLVVKGNFERTVPKEIRIVQYLATIDDPSERNAALAESFSPGEEYTLYTKPEELYKWVKCVLDGYNINKQSSVIESVRQLSDPKIIVRIKQIKHVIESQYLNQ